MHTQVARAAGEDEQRLHLVAVWRDAHCFTTRERVALAVAEAVTRILDHEELERAIDTAKAVIPEEDVANLVFAAIAINSWNRVAIAGGYMSGTYRPRQRSD